MNIVILGLSITSSWGNGHATTYRSLVRGLAERGHQVLFLERDKPWYAANRDLHRPPYCRAELYRSLSELKDRYRRQVRSADLVVVGSYVPEGIAVGEWVVSTARGIPAFYDIDTPVTLASLANGGAEYLSAELIPRFRLYLSFTGGPLLKRVETELHSPCARPLYCSFDPGLYYPEPEAKRRFDLGYLGTYSADRQPALERLLLTPARRWPEGRMIVAGSLYPGCVEWPRNVERREHLAPPEHRGFYNSLRYALNITRADMVRAGYSPSVRLFEAAACGAPIITDRWSGLDSLFEIGSEIFVAASPDEALSYLRELPESARTEVGERARRRVLAGHTAAHRARELEVYVADQGKGTRGRENKRRARFARHGEVPK